MKQITVDFTKQTIVNNYDLGKIGEHNATELTITPPNLLTEDQRTAMYRIAFETGRATVLSEAFTSLPITLSLWQQLTMHAQLSLQVVAYDTNGEFIGKSEKLTGFYFYPSVEAQEVINEDDTPDITAEISKNTAARHTHSNKAILDAITSIPNSVVEIWDSGTSAKYTADELNTMTNHQQTCFTYKGYPVVAYGGQTVPSEFYFTYLTTKTTADMNIMQYFAKCKVNNIKKITEGTAKILPIKVNGQSADNNGNISLNASHIKAPIDWSPENDNDIATKKYVDDHSGGIIEKTIELDLDWEVAAVAESMYGSSGEEIFLFGDQTQQGGLLYNARVTGLDVGIAGSWYNAYQILNAHNFPIIPQIPLVVNIDGDDYTFIGFTWELEGSVSVADKVRIHYIEIAGVQPVTPPSQE